MKLTHHRLTVLLLTGWLTLLPSVQAADLEVESYGQTVGRKALSGLANIGTSILEIPKNIINITNESNIAFGLAGGGLQALINMGGRTMVGISDLILAPLPTQPIVYPLYVWEDFEADTSYGPIFRVCQPNNNPCYR